MKRIIEGYAPDVDVRILVESDMLDGGDVLPGFTMRVADVFTH